MKDNLVAVELMSMDSEPGYVPSYGYQEAILVEAEEAVACGSDPEALYDLSGEEVTEGMLSDIEHRSHRTGALRYSYDTGTFMVPEGCVVVQKLYESICTNDGPYSKAWVVSEESLVELYQKRAEEYKRLADDLIRKRIGFSEFKEAHK
jgi:hypothetical protein